MKFLRGWFALKMWEYVTVPQRRWHQGTNIVIHVVRLIDVKEGRIHCRPIYLKAQHNRKLRATSCSCPHTLHYVIMCQQVPTWWTLSHSQGGRKESCCWFHRDMLQLGESLGPAKKSCMLQFWQQMVPCYTAQHDPFYCLIAHEKSCHFQRLNLVS